MVGSLFFWLLKTTKAYFLLFRGIIFLKSRKKQLKQKKEKKCFGKE